MGILKVIERNYQSFGGIIYLLFALYSLTLAPLITDFINYNEQNYFVAFMGFAMYFGEIFAFRYKLKKIRIRTEKRWLNADKATRGNIPVPSPWGMALVGVLSRMIFRMAFIYVSMTALGFPTTETNMSVPGNYAVIIAIVIEVFVLYSIFNSGVLRTVDEVERDTREEKNEDELWRKENITTEDADEYERNEFVADTVLYLYSFMLFTAFWDYINNLGIDMVHSMAPHNGAFIIGLELLPLLLTMSVLGIVPLRLAYWVETSANAMTQMDKWKMRGLFLFVVIVTIAPTIREYLITYF